MFGLDVVAGLLLAVLLWLRGGLQELVFPRHLLGVRKLLYLGPIVVYVERLDYVIPTLVLMSVRLLFGLM